MSDPSTKALHAMSEKLGVSADYLIGLTNSPHGQFGDTDLNQDERDMVDAFRRDGWPSVIRLGAEPIVK